MSKCIKCAGSGRIPNPNYPDNARALDRQYESGYLPYPRYEARLIELFGSMAKVPDDYIRCPVCRGSGRAGRHTSKAERAYHGS